MKKGTKLGLGAMTLLLGAVVLTGCTSSFCNNKDLSHMLYAYDAGVTVYSNTEEEGFTALTIADYEISNVYYKTSFKDAYAINKVNATALKGTNNITYAIPSMNYWRALDIEVLKQAYDLKKAEDPSFKIDSADDINTIMVKDAAGNDVKQKGILEEFGYTKFYDTENNGKTLFANWDILDQKVRDSGTVSIDECPTSDYIALYKTTLKSYVQQNRSCLTTKTGDYGYYGPKNTPVEIEGKSWASAFSKTSFLWLEGILVWPMGAFIDIVTDGMLKANVAPGLAQLLSILIITVLVRSIMLLVTWKQSSSSAKMNELQPQIEKIQAKYPNANSNTYEKQRLAQETADLYKKNKINPLTSILVMFIQFPVFLCVWAALQGSSILSSGSLFGLNFVTATNAVLFNASEWNIAAGGGALTALILFLLMAGAQIVSMLLPQWIQKSKAKNVAKLGNNPAKKSQDNKMKWFTYIMCAMIIFMGFSLASGMVIYWFVGALFSIGQTLIMNYATSKKSKKK